MDRRPRAYRKSQPACDREGRVILIPHHGDGAGMQTTYTQMVSDHSGIPMDKIDIVQGDTDLATGFGSIGFTLAVRRRTGALCGVRQRHDRQGAREGVEYFWKPPSRISNIGDGWLTVVGTDSRIGLFEIAKKENGARLSVDSEGEVDGPSCPRHHICEVEIDPETGISKVVRYTTVDRCRPSRSIRCW